ILLSIPEARQPVPEAMARASLTGAPLTVAARRQDFLEYTVFPRQVLERAEEVYVVHTNGEVRLWLSREPEAVRQIIKWRSEEAKDQDEKPH
ncbi:MAG TPA: hypothetical protein P5532_21785, partial [Planctomycetota bacterium]|nr:hypothetical protein [Planctomycetota bacterium]